MSRTAAFNIYTNIYRKLQKHPYSAIETPRVCNRLGLMYHKGSEHIAIDRDEAKAMYTRLIERERSGYETSKALTQRINAMCNWRFGMGSSETTRKV